MRAGRRDLDIVLYGATGFIGKLAAEYLAKAGPQVRVALAGRSLERLHAVRRGLGACAQDWPLIVADLAEPAALHAMAAAARVVVSAVGPYSSLGLPVVAACAATGTDYIDVTGEVPFVRNSIDHYHQLAVGTGARIVHSCGFDSIPSDMTVYALHRRVADDDAGELANTTLVLRDYSGGYAGGSAATMVELMKIAAEDPAMRQVLEDPFSLSPDRSAEPDPGPQPDLPLWPGAEIAPELAGLFTGGYVMAFYNTRCVRRSNTLLGWAYGRRFRYVETMSTGSLPTAPIVAAMVNALVGGSAKYGGYYLRMLPPGLVARLTPPSGTGHDEGAGGHYRVQTYTTTSVGARYVATMAQDADPGYSATAVLLGESALALALDRDRLPARSGVLTPATAMGDLLMERLPAAGVKLDIEQLH